MCRSLISLPVPCSSFNLTAARLPCVRLKLLQLLGLTIWSKSTFKSTFKRTSKRLHESSKSRIRDVRAAQLQMFHPETSHPFPASVANKLPLLSWEKKRGSSARRKMKPLFGWELCLEQECEVKGFLNKTIRHWSAPTEVYLISVQICADKPAATRTIVVGSEPKPVHRRISASSFPSGSCDLFLSMVPIWRRDYIFFV